MKSKFSSGSLSSWSRWAVIGPFLVAVGLLALLSAASVETLGAVRAYVGGESLWSKGQKDAMYALGRYVETRDQSDYRRFQGALAIPLGDQQARLAMSLPEPRLDLAREGLLAGGNHPDDLDGVIRLFLRFHEVPLMAEAIAIWAEGDEGIEQLALLGERVHTLITSGQADTPAMRDALAGLPAINERLTLLEERFSTKLGDVSRTAQRIVLAATLLMAAILALAGVLLTGRILRRQARTEAALRRSHEHWDMAAAAAGLGVFEWDLDADRVTLDPRAAALVGLLPAGKRQFRGQSVRETVHPDDRQRVLAEVEQALARREPLESRFRVRRPGRAEQHLEINADGATVERGQRRMLGILWDVTTYVQAEQLRLDRDAAERANRAKTEFLSRVSHELRTPLNAILGFTQLLLADRSDPVSSTQAARIGHVMAGGQHLLGLINDVLDLSSIDQGALTLSTRDLDLADLLRGCVHRVEPLTKAQDVSIHFDPPADGAPMHSDPLRLQQVFSNLLSNAIKYNVPGGRVDVELALQPQSCEVTIRDTGRGMTEAQVAQLFQPFNRLGAEYSQIEGSGLGLVITRQLTERMGGQLKVDSKPGEGSSFSLSLPREIA